MTLVVALVCIDGIVIASDSQVSYGQAPLKRTTGPKLHLLGPNIVLGSAGTIGPIQEITEKLEQLIRKQSDPTARSIRDDARTVVHGVTKDHLERLRALGDEDPHPPTGEIVLVSAKGGPCVCHVHPDGYYEEEVQYCAMGSAMLYAELLLRDHFRPDLTIEEGKVLAYWTLKNASEVDTFVGGPFQMKVVDPSAVTDVSHEELNALNDDYLLRKSITKDLFRNWKAVSSPVLKLLSEIREKEQTKTPATSEGK